MWDPTVNLEAVTIDSLLLPHFRECGVEVRVLRLDKIHPEISGNKWFKLKYYLLAGKQQKKEKLISFGGPYSNHLVALACAARAYGFASAGYIRGEKPAVLSPALFTAQKYGMQFRFLSRADYREKEDPQFLDYLRSAQPEALIIPEGGYGEPGIRGAGELFSLFDAGDYSHLCCAVGTGATITGLLKTAKPHLKIEGISILKGTRGIEPLQADWIQELEKANRLEIWHAYHFGGYAKNTPALLNFMNALYAASGIPTDFVYTGKLFYAVDDLIRKNHFPAGCRILIIHSGGLQGNLSLAGGQLHF